MQPAWANPTGAQVVHGMASLTQQGNTLSISNSPNAIINWQAFSINTGETTRFLQQSSTSAVLNRVVGTDPSQLLGQLTSNGHVFLINPNGVLVGQGARIDSASFVASTLELADSDFLAGRWRFNTAASGQAGAIQNNGVITTGPGGTVALIAPNIQNAGIVQTPDGRILLAAGRRIEIASLELGGITFEIQAPTDSVLNLGQLLAENGAIKAFAGSLRSEGEIRATRLTVDGDGSVVLSGSQGVTLVAGSVTSADGSVGGSVKVLSAQGVTRVGGDVLATGSAGRGGSVQILGERVALESGALVDASGTSGGGQILVGGDFQGKNPEIQNAARTFVGEATLKADAIDQGNGGRVIVWADENTRFQGHVSAKGGAVGGDGGFAEVSGKQNLEFVGTADLGATQGIMGELLLDPLDLVVAEGSAILNSVVDEFTDFPANVVTIAPSKLASLKANITLQANRDVFIKDKITLTTSGADLAITAGGSNFDQGNIYLENSDTRAGGIVTTGGDVTLRAQSISGPGTITTSGGTVDLVTNGTLNYSSAINSGDGAVNLGSVTGNVAGVSVNAGSGAIQVLANSSISGGSYQTTGVLSATATNGSLSINDATVGVAQLNAKNSVSASVTAAARVDATSTSGSVSLTNAGTDALLLGTLSANSSISLSSNTGFSQVAGGEMTTPSVYFYTNNSTASTGSLAAPIQLTSASPETTSVYVAAYNLASGLHLNLKNGARLGGLNLSGNVAGIGTSSITGASNTSIDLGISNGNVVLNASSPGSLAASQGMTQGLSLNLTDGGLTSTQIDLQGGGYLSLTLKGDALLGNVTTTRSSGTGLYVLANACSYYTYSGCAFTSSITAEKLDAGTGNIELQTYDNGIIQAQELISRDARLYAGQIYYSTSSPYYLSTPTFNTIDIGKATLSRNLTAYNYGSGDIDIKQLSASGDINIQAGSSYLKDVIPSPQQYIYDTTENAIRVEMAPNQQPGEGFYISNRGKNYIAGPEGSEQLAGGITVTGDLIRTNYGDISLSAAHGDVAIGTPTARSNISAYYEIDIDANDGNILLSGDVTSNNDSIYLSSGSSSGSPLLGHTTVLGDISAAGSYGEISIIAAGQVETGTLTAGNANAYYSNVTVQAGSDVVFDAIDVEGYSGYGDVSVTSSNGSIFSRDPVNDALTPDISASGNVMLSAANGSLGMLTPMNIRAGQNSTVNLTAGLGIGTDAVAFPLETGHVTVDTEGTIKITTSGQFFVDASGPGSGDPATPTERNVGSIEINASATGMGTTGTSKFNSKNLDLAFASDGSTLTLNNNSVVTQATDTLNQLSINATGGLSTGGFSLGATNGTNLLNLSASGALTIGGPINTTGETTLTATETLILSGNLQAKSIVLSGQSVNTQSLTSTGTDRDNDTLDWIKVSAGSGGLVVNGDITSASSIDMASGGTATVNGNVVGTGSFVGSYYETADRIRLGAASNISISGYVSSPRSVELTTGGDLDVAGHMDGVSVRAGEFGGSYYQATDTLKLQAGNTGTVATAGDIFGGYHQSFSAENLQTGNITKVASGSTQLTAKTFTLGDISTPGTLTITANGTNGYALGNRSLNSSQLMITAAQGDIDLNGDGTVSAPTVNLTATTGNISAALTGTDRLTLSAGQGFNVSSDAWLNYLDVTAKWDAAVAASSVGASVYGGTDNASQSFNYSIDGDVVYINASSGSSTNNWTLNYRDSSAQAVQTHVNFSHYGSGAFNVNMASTEAMELSGSLGATSVTVANAGQINVSSLTTANGNIQLTSSGQGISADYLSTSGGNVSLVAKNQVDFGWIYTNGTSGGDVNLTSTDANVLVDSAAVLPSRLDLQDLRGTINAASGNTTPLPGGRVTLSAGNGSVGGATVEEAIWVNSGSGLTLTAKDTLHVSAEGSTLSSLNVDIDAQGAGTLYVNGGNLGVVNLNRSANLITLGAINASTPGSFGLVARNGGIQVDGDLTNLSGLTLDAKAGDVNVVASASARTITSAGALNLKASNDILLSADSAALTVTGTSMDWNAGRDIQISANSALVSVAHSGNINWTAGRSIAVLGGSSSGASAKLESSNTSQQVFNVGGDFSVNAGAGTDAFALIKTQGHQRIYGANNLNVEGGKADTGQGTGAYASIQGGSQDFDASGDVKVLGGTADLTHASIQSAGYQYVGSTWSGDGITNSVEVRGGSGSNAYAKLSAQGTQNVHAAQEIVGSNTVGTGDIDVVGGTGAGSYAEVVTTGSQSVGQQSVVCYYYGCYYSTQNLTVTGGGGSGSYASIKASNQQSIGAGGDIDIKGGTGTGSYAELQSTNGGQSIGGSSTSQNDATGDITVQAGSGGVARILAQNSQTLRAGGSISVLGGSSAGMTASIESTAGNQSIGYAYDYAPSNDATQDIVLAGGTGVDAYARIRSFSGQTVDAGGNITLTGGSAGSYAEIYSTSTTSGSQTIGNYSNGYDRTDSITLTSGQADGAYTRIRTDGGSQTVYSTGAITITGGTGDNTGAGLTSTTGQSIYGYGGLNITGATDIGGTLGSDGGIRNLSTGGQYLAIYGDINIAGGRGNADTGIVQLGTGSQTIYAYTSTQPGNLTITGSSDTSDTGIRTQGSGQYVYTAGNLTLQNPHNTNGTTQLQAAGNQTLTVLGSITLDNSSGKATEITSSGTQSVTAASLTIGQGGSQAQAFSGLKATGAQTVTLIGDETTANSAYLNISNLNSGTGSKSGVLTDDALTLRVTDSNYDTAGTVQVGSTASVGASEIYAGTQMDLIAGKLTIQGGATAEAKAAVNAGVTANDGTMNISTLYGPTQLLGGQRGSATIDPQLLNMSSNGSVLLQAGASSTAFTNITAGTLNMAALFGNLNLVNSASATSTITATTFNLSNPPAPTTNFTALVSGSLLSMWEQSEQFYEMVVDEDGTVTYRNRAISQCYGGSTQ